jgi:hypothetical protein
MENLVLTDEEFLGYVEYHCRTERALFEGAHVKRLLELAGEFREANSRSVHPNEFVVMRPEFADPLIKKARERMALVGDVSSRPCPDPSTEDAVDAAIMRRYNAGDDTGLSCNDCVNNDGSHVDTCVACHEHSNWHFKASEDLPPIDWDWVEAQLLPKGQELTVEISNNAARFRIKLPNGAEKHVVIYKIDEEHLRNKSRDHLFALVDRHEWNRWVGDDYDTCEGPPASQLKQLLSDPEYMNPPPAPPVLDEPMNGPTAVIWMLQHPNEELRRLQAADPACFVKFNGANIVAKYGFPAWSCVVLAWILEGKYQIRTPWMSPIEAEQWMNEHFDHETGVSSPLVIDEEGSFVRMCERGSALQIKHPVTDWYPCPLMTFLNGKFRVPSEKIISIRTKEDL